MLHILQIQKADMSKYSVCFCGDCRRDFKEFGLFSFITLHVFAECHAFKVLLFNKYSGINHFYYSQKYCQIIAVFCNLYYKFCFTLLPCRSCGLKVYCQLWGNNSLSWKLCVILWDQTSVKHLSVLHIQEERLYFCRKQGYLSL